MQLRPTREDDPSDWFWMAEERLRLADAIWKSDGLVVTATGFDQKLSQYEDMADMLTEQFFVQHYPGGDLTDFGTDYELIRSNLGEVVMVVRSLLPQHFKV